MNTSISFVEATDNCLTRFRGWQTDNDREKVLNALKTGKLYFSTALGYNDPYDTLMYVNYEKLISKIIGSWTNMDGYVSRLSEKAPQVGACARLISSLENPCLEELQKAFLEYVIDEVEKIKLKLKGNIKGICFSKEKATNLMWAHYAYNHCGIALCYDQQDLIQSKCYSSTGEEIKNRFVLEPIQYCTKRPDATDFVEAYLLETLRRKRHKDHADVVDDWPLVRIKTVKEIIVTKDTSWGYEQEVRLIPRNLEFDTPKNVSYMKIKPRAVVLGAKMDAGERKEVVDIVRGLGDVALYCAVLHDGQSGYTVDIQEYPG